MTMIKSTIIGGAAASEESGRATEREVSTSFFLIISILPLAFYHPPPHFPLLFLLLDYSRIRRTQHETRHPVRASCLSPYFSPFAVHPESVGSSDRFSLFRWRTRRRCRGLRRSATLMESVASDEETRRGDQRAKSL